MMSFLDRATFAVALVVSFQHFAFFILETFLWQHPIGRKVFHLTPEKAEITAPLAKNQGVYNAFLGAGFLWGLSTVASGGLGYAEFSRSILTFFFVCVVIAGCVGAATVSRRIFFVQAVPALLGWGLLLARGGAPS